MAVSLDGIRGVVYLVEDEPGVRRALTRLIRSANLEAHGFSSAEEFLEFSPPLDKPACLLVDLILPGQSGIALQRRLRERQIEIPLIFMSGQPDFHSGVQAMKSGAIDFIEKPISNEVLTAALERALDADRTRCAERKERVRLENRFGKLTPREREVFDLIADGWANKKVGAKLGTTEKTVKVHRARVMDKMEAESFADLVRMADRLGPP